MTPAIDIKQLSKVYSGGFQALKGIDLTVQQGDFFALLGPNGAGKSTTIGIMCSLVNKTSGKVKIFGVDIDEDFPAAKRHIGVVPQEFNFNQFEKVFDIVVTQAGYYGIETSIAKERTEKYLKMLDLWDKRNESSRMLSGGMKRRLMIARALIHEPKLLILDEPTAGVDIEMRRSMWDILTQLNESGTTIILTTHYLEEAESLCRNIAIIDNGKIIQHTDMRSLLAELDAQTYILDLKSPISEMPNMTKFGLVKVDDHTLEVNIKKDQSINVLFEQLNKSEVVVKSIRNKANRLEEMFVRLTEKTI
ncbi:MAG: ABC transporter ATP-binding protein [Pseudomonadales bacterium]|nr:ABC transporter ATP-binding protein [Pseudomonadales bacterium]